MKIKIHVSASQMNFATVNGNYTGGTPTAKLTFARPAYTVRFLKRSEQYSAEDAERISQCRRYCACKPDKSRI